MGSVISMHDSLFPIPDSRFPTPCLIPYHDHYIQSFTDDFFTAPIPYLLPLVPLFPIPCSLHSLVFRSYSLFPPFPSLPFPIPRNPFLSVPIPILISHLLRLYTYGSTFLLLVSYHGENDIERRLNGSGSENGNGNRNS